MVVQCANVLWFVEVKERNSQLTRVPVGKEVLHILVADGDMDIAAAIVHVNHCHTE